MNDDTDVPPRSSRQNPAYRPTSDTPALHSQRIQSDARQIHTRSVAPYCCAIRALCRPIAAQYGLRLRLCAHCVARIRLRYRPISRVALNTGSLSSRGCAPLTPGCILAPFQGARCRSNRILGLEGNYFTENVISSDCQSAHIVAFSLSGVASMYRASGFSSSR